MRSDSFAMVIFQAMTVLIPMILSLTVHEYAHAFVAKRFGDDTAERLGRLTLNPLAHADPFGTLIMPMLSLVAGGMGMGMPFFGWAKPVPVDAGRFRRSISVRWGSAAVSAAGPLSNLLMALLCGGLLSVLARQGAQTALAAHLPPAGEFLLMMVRINAALFVFNLIPIYPLDGQKVVSGFLSPGRAISFDKFNQQYGVWVLWGIILFGRGIIATPVIWVGNVVLSLVGLT